MPRNNLLSKKKEKPYTKEQVALATHSLPAWCKTTIEIGWQQSKNPLYSWNQCCW